MTDSQVRHQIEASGAQKDPKSLVIAGQSRTDAKEMQRATGLGPVRVFKPCEASPALRPRRDEEGDAVLDELDVDGDGSRAG